MTRQDVLAGIAAKVNGADPAIRKAWMLSIKNKSATELDYIFNAVRVTGDGDIQCAKRPARSKKADNTGSDKKDTLGSLGFKKEDYPWVAAVAVLAINSWGFNAGTLVSILVASVVDLLVVYYLYRRFWPKRDIKSPKKDGTVSKSAIRDAVTKNTPKRASQDEPRGIFGLRRRQYPLVGGTVLLVTMVAAVRSGSPVFMAVAGVFTVITLYWLYRRYRKNREV